MKRLIAIALMLCAFGSYAQKVKKVKNKTTGGFIEEYYVLKSDRNLRHGKYTLSYDKKEYIIGTYADNKKVGLWTMSGTYAIDDANLTEEEYESDKLIFRRNFYSSGIETTSYFNGNEQADSIISIGPIFKRTQLPQKDETDIVRYYIRGERKAYVTGKMQNERREGLWTFRLNDLITTVNYVNGKREGELRTLTEDGVLLRVQTYKGGRIHGQKLAFYENGDTLLCGDYVDGDYVGLHKIFYRKGELFTVAKFSGNRLIEYRAYNDEGEILPGSITNGNGKIIFYKLKDSLGTQTYKESFSINIKNGYRHGEEQIDGKNIGSIYKNGIATEYQNIKLRPHSDTTYINVIGGGYYSYSYDAKIPTTDKDFARRTMAENIRYPMNAMQAEKQGTVLCKFYIDEFGEIYHIESINEKLGYGLEESAEDSIWYLNYTLSASIDFGCPFNTVYQVPINFQLY